MERLGDLYWPKETRNDASTKRPEVVEAFGIDNLRKILELVVPHDRAVCLFRFLTKDKTMYGRDWAAQQHIDELDGWDKKTIPMINKRFIWFYEAFFGADSGRHSVDLEYWLVPKRASLESVTEPVGREDEEDPVADEERELIRAIAWKSVSEHCDSPKTARLYYDTPECQSCLQNLIRVQQGLKSCVELALTLNLTHSPLLGTKKLRTIYEALTTKRAVSFSLTLPSHSRCSI